MHEKQDYFLTSARLGFRCWREEDFELALGLWGDLRVTRLIDARGQLTQEQVRQKLEQEMATAVAYRVQYWPIFLLTTGEHIGCCGLRPYDLPQKIYEIGFHIRSPFWGQGFATEAAQRVIDYAFTDLAVAALFAGHNPHNHASRSVLQKLGFRYTHDAFYKPTGLYHPSYRLTGKEHKNKRHRKGKEQRSNDAGASRGGAA
jgi:RimJ/RimL family protein N-acetyltransferase